MTELPQPDLLPARQEMSFEEFDALLGFSDGRSVPLARSMASWKLHSLTFDGIDLQVMQEGGANTYMGATPPRSFTFGLGLPGSSFIESMGISVDKDHMCILRPNDELVSHSSGVTQYCTLTLPVDRLLEVAQQLSEEAAEFLMSAPNGLHVRPMCVQRALSVFQRVWFAAEAGSFSGERGQAKRAASEELICAFVDAATSLDGPSNSLGRPMISRQQILGRVRDFLNKPSAHSYSVAAMARHAGVSERTLRSVFLKTFGVGPKRLLIMKQLSTIRSELQQASPETSIAELASTHGVWEMSRFARRYRETFGERPSDTLAASTGTILQ